MKKKEKLCKIENTKKNVGRRENKKICRTCVDGRDEKTIIKKERSEAGKEGGRNEEKKYIRSW